jgi:catechol 2,3-dioxygenase-like lactoylglutathione lyase family enzyme
MAANDSQRINIVGPDALVFGVDDTDACATYLTDYGLKPAERTDTGDSFQALDGTRVEIRRRDDPTLPPALESGSKLRETIYGVADEASLGAIAAELSKDRPVSRCQDGSICSVDDSGFALRFRQTIRRPYEAPSECVNSPGAEPQRMINHLGVDVRAKIAPRTLSHVVYFVPDSGKAERFYNRLGFRCTDRFAGVGPFMRPAGTLDHHTLFLIQAPAFMKGLEHFTFHLGGPTEVLLAGSRFAAKGHTSFWGPGRHVLGSNWFWYFNSPMGCHMEYDADMDLHDDSWIARTVPMALDTSQLFLFQVSAKWLPGGK